MSEVFYANGGNQSWQVWVSLKGKTKMAESKMAEFKMAAIIKLSQNEWVKFFMQMLGREVWVKFFCANGGTNLSKCEWVWQEKTKMAESKMAKFKMAAIIKLSPNEWVWVRLN